MARHLMTINVLIDVDPDEVDDARDMMQQFDDEMQQEEFVLDVSIEIEPTEVRFLPQY